MSAAEDTESNARLDKWAGWLGLLATAAFLATIGVTSANSSIVLPDGPADILSYLAEVAEGATGFYVYGIAGLILPMGDHKGSCISVMMDVLSGALTGANFLAGVCGPYQAETRSGAGHMALALDIAPSRPLAEFEADMERLIGDLKSVPPADGFDEVFFPGEIEARADARNWRDGLVFPEDTRAGLRDLAREMGLEARLPF